MQLFQMNGAPGKIRTPNLLIRSQTLYPIELRARGRRAGSAGRVRKLIKGAALCKDIYARRMQFSFNSLSKISALSPARGYFSIRIVK
jgi:hypothetical protein